MDEPTTGQALEQLLGALKRLEAAVERRAGAERSIGELQDQVQRLEEDRSELARKLDAAEARAARLEETNRAVSRRLVEAMEKVRALLQHPHPDI